MHRNGGERTFSSFYFHEMIDKNLIAQVVEEYLQNTDGFLVDVKVSADNQIIVEIDSDTSVDIDTCVAINRLIEEKFDRDVEDYALEVGSAGITSPFKHIRQYQKNIGNEVEVLAGGRKYVGELVDVTDDGFSIEYEAKDKATRKKVLMRASFAFDEAKYVKYNLKFN